MMDNLILLWMAAFPLMGSPGPATLSLAGIGSAYGFRVGLRYMFGIVVGTVVVLLMIATGITTVVLTMPSLLVVLSSLAGLYILYLAFRIATAPAVKDMTSVDSTPRFLSGFTLAVINPKAFAAIGAVYASHTVVARNMAADTGWKLLALSLVIIIFSLFWLSFGAAFSKFLSNPAIARTTNIIFAVMLILSVGSLWLGK